MSPVTTPLPETAETPAPPVLPSHSPHPPRIRRWWLRLVVSVLACAGVLVFSAGVFNWLSSFKREPPRQSTTGISKTYSVSVYEVQPLDLQRVICAFGTAVADREVVVAAEVAGQVIEASRLKVGRSVESAGRQSRRDGISVDDPGDLLVRIDPQTYQAPVLQARNLLAQDAAELKRLEQEHANNRLLLETEQTNLTIATTEYESVVKLKTAGVGTDSSVRQAKLEMARYQDAVHKLENELRLYDPRREAIEARMDAHRSDLELAQLDLERTQVRAPFAGVLSSVHVEEGQYVRPGDQLVRLTDPGRVEVPLSLTLSDYLAVAALCEQTSRIRVALAENETGAPRWSSDPLGVLRQAPEADERTRTVMVYTEVDNSQQPVPLLPGTFVHARIPGPIVEDAVAIPRDALVEGTVFVAVPLSAAEVEPASESDAAATSSPGGWSARVERRAVTTGRTLQSLVLVREGLQAGEWIVTTNLDVIYEGAQLRIDGPSSQRSLQDELARLRTPRVRIVKDSLNAPQTLE